MKGSFCGTTSFECLLETVGPPRASTARAVAFKGHKSHVNSLYLGSFNMIRFDVCPCREISACVCF